MDSAEEDIRLLVCGEVHTEGSTKAAIRTSVVRYETFHGHIVLDQTPPHLL